MNNAKRLANKKPGLDPEEVKMLHELSDSDFAEKERQALIDRLVPDKKKKTGLITPHKSTFLDKVGALLLVGATIGIGVGIGLLGAPLLAAGAAAFLFITVIGTVSWGATLKKHGGPNGDAVRISEDKWIAFYDKGIPLAGRTVDLKTGKGRYIVHPLAILIPAILIIGSLAVGIMALTGAAVSPLLVVALLAMPLVLGKFLGKGLSKKMVKLPEFMGTPPDEDLSTLMTIDKKTMPEPLRSDEMKQDITESNQQTMDNRDEADLSQEIKFDNDEESIDMLGFSADDPVDYNNYEVPPMPGNDRKVENPDDNDNYQSPSPSLSPRK